jgi:hypothetical protein
MNRALVILIVATGCSSGAGAGVDAGGSANTGIVLAEVGAADTNVTADSDGTPTDTLPVASDTTPDVKLGRVPSEHRAQATACQPTMNRLPPGGGQTCSSDSDCASDAAIGLFTHCLRGRCSFDECLSDADCTKNNGVCGCSTDYYGGNGAFHPNICAPANCHVDGDCGAGGYCTPNRGRCGVFEGFYCHRPTDACYDASECPAPTGTVPGCLYTPTVGAFVCGTGAVCNG